MIDLAVGHNGIGRFVRLWQTARVGEAQPRTPRAATGARRPPRRPKATPGSSCGRRWDRDGWPTACSRPRPSGSCRWRWSAWRACSRAGRGRRLAGAASSGLLWAGWALHLRGGLQLRGRHLPLLLPLDARTAARRARRGGRDLHLGALPDGRRGRDAAAGRAARHRPVAGLRPLGRASGARGGLAPAPSDLGARPSRCSRPSPSWRWCSVPGVAAAAGRRGPGRRARRAAGDAGGVGAEQRAGARDRGDPVGGHRPPRGAIARRRARGRGRLAEGRSAGP